MLPGGDFDVPDLRYDIKTSASSAIAIRVVAALETATAVGDLPLWSVLSSLRLGRLALPSLRSALPSALSLRKHWEHCFELLAAFSERKADCDVPARHEGQDVELGGWLETQRMEHKKGTLDAAKRTRLEALGLWPTNAPGLREIAPADMNGRGARHGRGAIDRFAPSPPRRRHRRRRPPPSGARGARREAREVVGGVWSGRLQARAKPSR